MKSEGNFNPLRGSQNAITESEILAFAREFDPQTFHTGEKAHTSSIYDGLIASGWHSGAIAMRLMVDSFIGESASLGSPGLDYLRWPNPMRPGDTVTLYVRVVEARRSPSIPKQTGPWYREVAARTQEQKRRTADGDRRSSIPFLPRPLI